jgi:hypothetical protein
MMELAYDQIANHMDVGMAIKDNIESLHGIAPSEPILLEAASHIMLSEEFSFSLHGALSLVLGGYCVNQGERGELMVSSFFAWARDQVVVDKTETLKDKQLCPYFSLSELFEQLFKDVSILDEGGPSIYHPKASPRKPSKEVFKEAMMHFNHLIKLCDQKSLKHSNILFL